MLFNYNLYHLVSASRSVEPVLISDWFWCLYGKVCWRQLQAEQLSFDCAYCWTWSSFYGKPFTKNFHKTHKTFYNCVRKVVDESWNFGSAIPSFHRRVIVMIAWIKDRKVRVYNGSGKFWAVNIKRWMQSFLETT